MCTAISDGQLFGRTLDLEASYGEKVVITPRKSPFSFIYQTKIADHLAIIGTAHIDSGVPLYYDAMNEKGLCAAALRFPNFAIYHEKKPQTRNLASFELIPWLLCQFDSADKAKDALASVNITPDSFSSTLPSTPLHWLIADKNQAFVVESVKEGLKIYDAPEGVLTNAPDFPAQQAILSIHGNLAQKVCSIGEKTVDLPGDSSSSSRFIRAWHAKKHTLPLNSNRSNEIEHNSAVTRFFHVCDTVSQPHGFARNDKKSPVRTVYTACMDTKSLIYYFTTYSCRQIRGVKLSELQADSDRLVTFPMENDEKIAFLS